MGIEPTSSAWKAEVLPLNYTRRWRPLEGLRAPPIAHVCRGLVGSRPITKLQQRRHREQRRSSFEGPRVLSHPVVEGVGFEPTKAEPADLQSAPVDRLGTPPAKTSRVF